MLSVENLTSGYGRIQALHGVSLTVAAGEIVTLVGANGAGKTTLIRAISGVQPISGGRIVFEDRCIDRIPAHARVALGIAQVPEGRQLFAPLSVEDNLRLGAWSRRVADIDAELASVYALFPMLAARRGATSGMLSGGQQQMLAIGRALMAKPRLLLLDEPSMGLAPMLVEQILDVVEGLETRGLDGAAGRAECARRARDRGSRLCGGDRQDRGERQRRATSCRRPRAGGVSWRMKEPHDNCILAHHMDFARCDCGGGNACRRARR